MIFNKNRKSYGFKFKRIFRMKFNNHVCLIIVQFYFKYTTLQQTSNYEILMWNLNLNCKATINPGSTPSFTDTSY